MLFELEDVTKTYGAVTALRGLTVSMPAGAIGLLGPNGAGKTTMIRTLLGLIRIDRGRGKVLDRDIHSDRMSIRQSVGFVPEDECLFPGMIGVEFAAFAGELCGMPSKDAMRRAHEVLDYVGLGEARYRKADSYSTGMKQRLKLAAGIVHDPSLLVLDEPTNGMDPAGRVEILELAVDLAHNKGMSLLFSSHLLPDVEAVCEHVMVLGRGRLLAQGRLEELKRADAGRQVLRLKEPSRSFEQRLLQRGCRIEPVGEDLMITLAPDLGPDFLWRMAAEETVQIRSLKPQRSTLEDVFHQALASDHD